MRVVFHGGRVLPFPESFGDGMRLEPEGPANYDDDKAEII